MVVNTALGMFTPPFDLNLFLLQHNGYVYSKIIKSCVSVYFAFLITVLLVTYVPDISLWLPRQVYGAW